MSKRVTITRKRLIEEKFIKDVVTADPAAAVSTALGVSEEKKDWQYNRTLETSEGVIQVTEIKTEKEG
jgi:hypothetical protein